MEKSELDPPFEKETSLVSLWAFDSFTLSIARFFVFYFWANDIRGAKASGPNESDLIFHVVILPINEGFFQQLIGHVTQCSQ